MAIIAIPGDNHEILLAESEKDDAVVGVIHPNEVSEEMRELIFHGYTQEICEMVLAIRKLRVREMEFPINLMKG